MKILDLKMLHIYVSLLSRRRNYSKVFLQQLLNLVVNSFLRFNMKLKTHRSLFQSLIYFQVLLKNELILDFQYFVQIYQALGGKLIHILL